MSADFLRAIDWSRPWLAPYRQLGQTLAGATDWRAAANDYARGIQNSRGLPVQFVPQSELPGGTAYEAFIAQTGMVPTRENLHDFFNALVWLTFPRVKSQLNARQAAEIAARGGTSTIRGPVRDAATLFDENAALLVSRDHDLLDAVRGHQWEEAFLTRRSLFAMSCEVILFGHALMEKLVSPYKAITAHAWPLYVDNRYFALTPDARIDCLDERVAADLRKPLAPASFSPLPVLGVPGWWEAQDTQFYADKGVFRPKRKQK